MIIISLIDTNSKGLPNLNATMYRFHDIVWNKAE